MVNCNVIALFGCESSSNSHLCPPSPGKEGGGGVHTIASLSEVLVFIYFFWHTFLSVANYLVKVIDICVSNSGYDLVV